MYSLSLFLKYFSYPYLSTALIILTNKIYPFLVSSQQYLSQHVHAKSKTLEHPFYSRSAMTSLACTSSTTNAPKVSLAKGVKSVLTSSTTSFNYFAKNSAYSLRLAQPLPFIPDSLAVATYPGFLMISGDYGYPAAYQPSSSCIYDYNFSDTNSCSSGSSSIPPSFALKIANSAPRV